MREVYRIQKERQIWDHFRIRWRIPQDQARILQLSILMNLCINEHRKSHYLLSSPCKRKYDGRFSEELLLERNDYLKKIVEQDKTIEKMQKDIENNSELKEIYDQ